MESITFSDTNTQQAFTPQETEEEGQVRLLPLEEYCKRNPDAIECLEYDL